MYTMPRSFPYLLLAILSLSHRIQCADNDTKPNDDVAFATYNDGWFTRDITITEPHSVLMWEGGSPHKRFYYLTWDDKKNYCEVTQVTTESAKGSSTKCRYQFQGNERHVQMRKLVLPDEGDSEIGISFTTSETRRTNSYYIRDVDFKTCQRYNAPEAVNQTDVSSTPTDEEDAKTLKIVRESDEPAQSSNRFDIYSNANGRRAVCKVNDELTQIACTQRIKGQSKNEIDVKYDLPTHWKADWFVVHNTKAGALLLYFSDCPNGTCKDYSFVRFTAKGWDGKRIVQHEMNLKCSDKSKLSVDVTDQDNDWVCLHAMCSEVKTDETVLKYRRQCVKGDATA